MAAVSWQWQECGGRRRPAAGGLLRAGGGWVVAHMLRWRVSDRSLMTSISILRISSALVCAAPRSAACCVRAFDTALTATILRVLLWHPKCTEPNPPTPIGLSRSTV